MDDNKLGTLRYIEYSIVGTCGTCRYSDIKTGSNWGVCKLHSYEHKKHSGGDKGSERDLSIHTLGSCKYIHIDQSKLYDIHAYEEFVE